MGKLGQRKRSNMVLTEEDMMSQILREKNEEQARYKMIFGTKDFDFNRVASEKKWALASQTSKSQTKQSTATPLPKGAPSSRGAALDVTDMASAIVSDSTTERRGD